MYKCYIIWYNSTIIKQYKNSVYGGNYYEKYYNSDGS